MHRDAEESRAGTTAATRPEAGREGDASSPAERPAPALPARFRPERLLGTGGQADVWLAHDRELNEPVAIKVFRVDLDEVARERLRREVRLGRTLSHPRLVRLFELLELDGRLGVAMEWVPGGSLAERLKAGPLGTAEVVRVAAQTLEALAYLHAQGIVHRDVKPSNLLLDAAGDVRLADYGLARPLREADDLTRTAHAVGTPGYMSPEQLRGEAPGAAADLYGLGATLFELLTGRRPFAGSSAFEVARLHLTAPPPDPAALKKDCPPWLARFVLRLLAKRPADRFPGAEEASRSLAGRRVPISRRARARAAGLAGAVALVALAALALRAPLSRALRPAGPFRSVVSGSEVQGVGPQGEVLWRFALPGPPLQAVQADLEGDGLRETIVSIVPPARAGAGRREPSRILVLDARGKEVRSFDLEALVPLWPYDVPKELACLLAPMDLDGDGADEVVLNVRHRAFYPAVLVVYWPKLALWEPLFYHSGWIDDVRRVPGGRAGRIAFAGRNNRLGHLAVAGEIDVAPPSGDGRARYLAEQGLPPDGEAPPGLRLARYAFLGEHPAAVGSLAVGQDRGLRYSAGSRRFSLDALGNPVPGPNAGRDLSRVRVSLLAAARRPSISDPPETPGAVAARIAGLRRAVGPVLEEAASRVVVALVEGEARARAGDADGAREALRTARTDAPAQDVTWRLAHLEAIGGRLEEAHRLLGALGEPSTEGPASYDGPMLDLRVLVELGDAARHADVVRRILGWQAVGVDGAKGESLFVRPRLWRDQPEERDAATESWDFLPEGAALGALVRWRLGRTRPGDPESLAAAKERWPNAADELRVARAAALLGLGRAAEAVRELTQQVVVLEPAARYDFFARQTLDLALALHAKALEEGGAKEEARAEALWLRARTRPGFLPRILAEEVLREAGR